MAYNSEAAQAAQSPTNGPAEGAQGDDVSLALASSVSGQLQSIGGALQATALGAGPAIDQLADVATQMLNGQWAMNRFTERVAQNLETKGSVAMPQGGDAFAVNVEPVDLTGSRERFLGLFGMDQKALPNPFLNGEGEE